MNASGLRGLRGSSRSCGAVQSKIQNPKSKIRPRQGLRCAVAALAGLATLGCRPEYRPWWLGGAEGKDSAASSVFSPLGAAVFTEVLIQERTFTAGRVVTTVTHRTLDMARDPVLLDFNGDGKVDPVVGYAQNDIGIIQILLSYGPAGSVQYASLTLDGGENMWDLFSDVAVGDIDGDGNLDLIAATADGVVYLHHPTDPTRTHVLNEWGAASGAQELLSGTTDWVSEEEVDTLLAQALGPGGDASNYVVTVVQGYTSVEIADFNNDGFNDVAASRQLHITLTPKPEMPLPPLEIVGGALQLLLNPRRATTGENWTAVLIGQHERHLTLDRPGARDLRAYDVDGDGDLDLISTATLDDNVQVVWYENPAGPGPIDPGLTWLPHRIGSVRGAYTIDVADVTGDGRADVIATSPEQMQLVLFVQPASTVDRGYDWFTTPIVTFESYEPRSVKAVDVDNDGTLELVVGGTAGALRYFEPTADPTAAWVGREILDFDPPGTLGLLGYGDLDGDGDVDLVTVLASDSEDTPADRVSWVRNELLP
jgi:hypothetical protein